MKESWRFVLGACVGVVGLHLATGPVPAVGLAVGVLAFSVRLSRERASLTASIEQMRLDLDRAATTNHHLSIKIVESLAYAIEARTPQRLGHLARVQAHAIAIAGEMGLSDLQVTNLRMATLLHDIGRLGIPDSLLTKSGVLSNSEREHIRAYPVIGARLLSHIPFQLPIATLVRHHQERFDGSGYPDKLAGDEIPIEARILNLANTYDALTHARGHRPALSREDSLETIQAESGRAFDPAVVDAFMRVVDTVERELADALTESEPHGPAQEIAQAQMEVQAVYDLVNTVSSTLQLPELLDMLTKRLTAVVHCSTCVVFLAREEEDVLEAAHAMGLNASHFSGSTARLGTYLTGRCASRGDIVVASYMPDDVKTTPTRSPWTILRSTVIVPIRTEDEIIGTINLYHTDPDAFAEDDVRIVALIGDLIGRSVQNAYLFSQTQETAFTDALTQLKNARYLFQYLQQEMNRADKTNHTLAVLGLDLDGFKAINDTLGHARGDQVLREVGQVLQANVRNYDLVARYAGDEFNVVLPETERQSAEIVALKIKLAVERYAERVMEHDPTFPGLGVSVGLAIYPHDASGLEDLLAAADHGMYADKRAHKVA